MVPRTPTNSQGKDKMRKINRVKTEWNKWRRIRGRISANARNQGIHLLNQHTTLALQKFKSFKKCKHACSKPCFMSVNTLKKFIFHCIKLEIYFEAYKIWGGSSSSKNGPFTIAFSMTTHFAQWATTSNHFRFLFY